MGWLWGGKRGASWRDKTLESFLSLPLPLMVILGLVGFFMCLTTYLKFKVQVAKTTSHIKLALLVVPILVIFLVYLWIVSYRWFHPIGYPAAYRSKSGGGGGISPWGLALLVVLLLVMVHYQVSIQSSWFPLM